MATRVSIEVSLEQAIAVSEALEAYSRLGIGQINHVAELVSTGEIPIGGRCDRNGNMLEYETANIDQVETVRDLCDQIKIALGYSLGGSNGVGHPHVSLNTHRSWEVRKVLEKAIAEHRNPSPSFRGVSYDGLLVRYTKDPLPVVWIREAS